MIQLAELLVWAKNNKVAAGTIIGLALLLGWAGCANNKLAAELNECRSKPPVVQTDAALVAELQAKLATKCKGSVDLVVKPPTTGNSPCPEVSLKANFDDGSQGVVGSQSASSATARVGGDNACPSLPTWRVAVGGGTQAQDWHKANIGADLDYNNVRGTVTYGLDGTWSYGARVTVLTGNWP